MIKIFLLLLSFSVMATEDCTEQYNQFGSGEKINPLTQSCLDKVISAPIASVVNGDKKYLLGSNAIVVMDKEEVSHLIAGEYSGLKNLSAIAVSEVHNEIAVLESDSSEIKIFSSIYTGNTPPLRILKTNELVGVTQLSFDQDRICAYNPVQQTSYAYSREANALRRPQYQKLDLLAQFDQVSQAKCY